MLTIKHVLQFHACRLSEQIRQMKASARKIVTDHHWVFVSPDRKTFASMKTSPADRAGWTKEWVAYEKTVEFMSPRAPDWENYCSASRDASKWLTTIHLLKLGNGSLPLKKDVRKAIRAGLLSHHVARGRASAFVFAAYTELSNSITALSNDLASFAEVERFAAAREQEAQHARNP
jgi:hypothetical protein